MELTKIKIGVYNSNLENSSAVYVLSRGTNTGKLQNQPTANTYAIYAPSDLLPLVKAAAFILFQSKSLRPHLHGSVIEFVCVDTYRKLFFELWRSLSPENLKQVSSKLEALEQYSENLQNQLKKVAQLRTFVAAAAFR